MKNPVPILIVFLLFITGCTVASSEKENNNGGNKTYGLFEFDKDLYDFGVIKSGDTVYHDFKFTNTGASPIVIYNIAVQCGCTSVRWPKDPVKPQETGTIRIGFSKAAPALYQKTITIKANTKDPYYLLHISAEVKEKNIR